MIATASTDEKRSFLKNYGADHVLSSSGFREEVKALTDGRGVDVIYDPVGGDVFDESTRCIAFDGRLLVVGFTSGRIPTVSVNIPLIKGFSVMGMRAGEYGRKFPQKGRENIAALDAMLADGKLHPHVCARFPLSQAVDAMRMLEDRKAIGKVIVEP
ncbi:MAG: zinc-binding dehydrogenase [Rhizomicrobium sp.]